MLCFPNLRSHVRALVLLGWLGPAAASGPAQPAGRPVVEALERDLQRIVKEVGPSVVSVIATRLPRFKKGKRIEEESFWSSGIVLDRQGHVVTPAEPLQQGGVVVVYATGAGGERRQFRARFVGKDPVLNIAVVKLLVPPRDLTPVRTGDPAALRLGSIVVAFGCPYPFPTSCSWGMVSGLNREIAIERRRSSGLIMTTAPVNPGDSGGALADVRGRVVGMLMSTFEWTDRGAAAEPGSGRRYWPGARDINFALPVDRVLASAQAIVRKQSDLEDPPDCLWRFLGVRGTYLLEPNAVSSQLSLPPGTGFLVSELFEGEAAQRGGLRVHDVILRLGDVDIKGSDRSLLIAIRKAPLHQDVPVAVIRHGRRIRVNVRFGRPFR